MSNQNEIYKEDNGNRVFFKEESSKRPSMRYLNKGNFMVYHSDGHTIVNKNDVDDLIILLQSIKANDYDISNF